MVAHQHPSVNAPASHGARLAQRFEEQLPILIAPENLFAPIPSRHDVIEGTGILMRMLRGTERLYYAITTLSRFDA